MARYRKATITGITGPVYVSLELASDLISYVDPSTERRKNLGVTNKRASGEVRTEIDCSAMWGTTTTNVAVVFLEASGGTPITKTLPTVRWGKWKGETGLEDTKPAKFSLNFDAQVPA